MRLFSESTAASCEFLRSCWFRICLRYLRSRYSWTYWLRRRSYLLWCLWLRLWLCYTITCLLTILFFPLHCIRLFRSLHSYLCDLLNICACCFPSKFLLNNQFFSLLFNYCCILLFILSIVNASICLLCTVRSRFTFWGILNSLFIWNSCLFWNYSIQKIMKSIWNLI